MPLQAGARLGPYEIVSALGAGGMGEVYRARDGKLNRDVAIKILPASFATDPDRRRSYFNSTAMRSAGLSDAFSSVCVPAAAIRVSSALPPG